MDESPPLAADVNGLVTLSITSYGTNTDRDMRKMDLAIPQSGIIPFTLSLESARHSTSVSLEVCTESYLLPEMLQVLRSQVQVQVLRLCLLRYLLCIMFSLVSV